MVETASEGKNVGQAIYSKSVLAIYDLLVLAITHNFIWKCSTANHLELYNRHISNNHLDIGVGTGFFLDHCTFRNGHPRLALMDLNRNCLEIASKRVARYQPEIYTRNILNPIVFTGQKFDSVALNCVLHCLPGNMASKAKVFEYIKPLLNPGGIIFGSTVLSKGVKRSFVAKKVINFYVSKGIFSNLDDSYDDLNDALNQNFSESAIEVIGCTALFWARC